MMMLYGDHAIWVNVCDCAQCYARTPYELDVINWKPNQTYARSWNRKVWGEQSFYHVFSSRKVNSR